MNTEMTLTLEEQRSAEKELKQAIETEVQKSYKGFWTEPAENSDAHGTSPDGRKKGTAEEEQRREELRKEWANKPERPSGGRRSTIKELSTEDAQTNKGIDELDEEFTPTLQ